MLKCMQPCINYLKTQSIFLSNRSNVLVQQSRNTFILKRKYPIPLHKKHEKRPRLKHRHFIYELVEDTNCKPQKQIEVVLLDTVEKFGVKGEKIRVPSYSGYEKLLLPKLAVYATPENIEKYLIEDASVKQTTKYSSPFVERTINLMSQLYLNVNMSMDIPWTIEKWHIRVSFRKAGYIVPEDAITLPNKAISGPNRSYDNKEFYVTVKINNCEEVKVRCKVFHYTSDPLKKIRYDVPTYLLPSIAIFPEDQPVLDSLPKHRLANINISETAT